MAPNHNHSGVAQSSGTRRNTRTSRRLRKRAGVSGSSTGNSPSKRGRAQNVSNNNTRRRQNTAVNRRNSRIILSDSSSSDEEILDLSGDRPLTRSTRRAVRQNAASVSGTVARRQNNNTFGERNLSANSPAPRHSRLGMEDVFDAGFLDEVPSTPRVRCISFQSSPDSTPERDVTQLVSSDAQLSPLLTAPSQRTTRSRSSNESDGITERGIMGIRVLPVTLGESFGNAGDSYSAESPIGRRRRKRVVRRVSLQSTPDASPERPGHSSRSASVEIVNEVRIVPEASRSLRGSNSRRTIVNDDSSVVAEEVPVLPVTPSAQPQRRRRSLSHNGARTDEAGSDHRGSAALSEESAFIVDLTTAPSVAAEHSQRISPGYSSAQTVRVAESPIARPGLPPDSNPLLRPTPGQLRISMSGIAALNMRGRVLLSDDEESHNVHTGRMATARATDTSVGRNANIRRSQSALNEDSRRAAGNANSLRGIALDALAQVSPRTRMTIEAALMDDNPATTADESPPRYMRRATRPQRAVAIRAAELARRNRNLAASILGQLPREANSDSWRRPAVVIDFNLASSSDSDSSADGGMDYAGATANNEEAEARRRQELADFQLALRIAAEIDDDVPSGSTMQHTPPRNRGRYQRRSNTRQQRPLAPGQHCVICYEEQPDEPMGCLSCRQLIGCRRCIMKWRRTNNISELNRRSPLSIGCSSVNHRKCPLCRAEWDLDPEIAPWDELRTD